jgi:hypothetical protein
LSKYHNRRIKDLDGQTFDSKKEFRRWRDLQLLERAGQIEDLRRQVKYVLIPAQRIGGKVVERECSYIADYVYTKDGQTIVEDCKGFRKGEAYALFVIKRKLMLERYGIRIYET